VFVDCRLLWLHKAAVSLTLTPLRPSIPCTNLPPPTYLLQATRWPPLATKVRL